MEKYSKEELIELSKGVFADDKTAVAYYADANGNFKNEKQYEAMNKEAKAAFMKIENPNGQAETKAAGDPEAEKKLAEALKEIERLNGLKSVKEANAALAAKDATIAELEAKIVELSKPAPDEKE